MKNFILELVLISLFSFLINNNTFSQFNYQFDDNDELIENIKDSLSVGLEDFNEYQLLFLGEHHNTIDVSIDKIFIDKLLSSGRDFDLIYEIPHSQAYLINNYLMFGDELIFKTFEDSIYYMPIAFELNSIKKLKYIYDSSKVKFKVIGLEFNILGGIYKYSPQLALRDIFLKSDILNKSDQLSPELVTLVDILKIEDESFQFYRGEGKSLRKMCSTIIRSDPSSYKEIFGSYFFDFIQIVEDISIGSKCKTRRKKLRRDDFLFQRFSKLLKKTPNKFYLSRYGSFHVSKERIKGRKRPALAELLNNEKFKIKSIIIIPSYTPTYIENPTVFEKNEWKGLLSWGIKKAYSKEVSKGTKKYYDSKKDFHVMDYKITSMLGVDLALFLNAILVNAIPISSSIDPMAPPPQNKD